MNAIFPLLALIAACFLSELSDIFTVQQMHTVLPAMKKFIYSVFVIVLASCCIPTVLAIFFH
jgi:hypothetical protein